MRDRKILERDLSEGLPEENIDEFLEWYDSESELFKPPNIKWDDSLINKGCACSYKGCHYNSIFNSLKYGFDLYSGYVIQDWVAMKVSYKVHHSFNVIDSKVHDYTYYNNKGYFPQEQYKLPFQYSGVLIPINFINQINEEFAILGPGSVSSLNVKFNRMLVTLFVYQKESKDLSRIINEFMS